MFISAYFFVYVFIYWIICILLLLILSGYISVSCYYSVPSSIFRAQLHEVISNSNLCWQQDKEVTDKTSHEVAHTV